jgi:hypothetical protein
MFHFWRRIFEEMVRAKHGGTTYRFRGMMLTEEPIEAKRANRIGLYAYKRMKIGG